jgi:hypothetical protein
MFCHGTRNVTFRSRGHVPKMNMSITKGRTGGLRIVLLATIGTHSRFAFSTFLNMTSILAFADGGLEPSVHLFEGRDALDYQYVPIEMGMDFKDVVSPHDLAMAETIVLMTVAVARNNEITLSPSPPPNEESDEGSRTDTPIRARQNQRDKTRFQVSKDVNTHRYVFTFSFPTGTRVDLESANRIFASYPNRIIQRESAPFITLDGSLGWRWTVTMHGHSMYSRADVLQLHSDPTIQITHVFPESFGRNGEGRGVKRQRDAESQDRRVRGKKDV